MTPSSQQWNLPIGSIQTSRSTRKHVSAWDVQAHGKTACITSVFGKQLLLACKCEPKLCCAVDVTGEEQQRAPKKHKSADRLERQGKHKSKSKGRSKGN